MTEKSKFISKYIAYDKKWNQNYIKEMKEKKYNAFERIDDLLAEDPYLIMYEIVDEFSTLKNHFNNHEYQEIREKSNELSKLMVAFTNYLDSSK